MSWTRVIHEIGPELHEHETKCDATDTFVADNYALLKSKRVFSAGIPSALGGGGASHRELCQMVRAVGHHCASTALALGMHTHPVALNVFKHRRGQPVEGVLKKIADGQLVVCGTGANDGLPSSAKLTKVDGGYRLSGTKRFVSGAPGADLFVTSARYEDPEAGAQVLHFAVPMRSEGIHIEDVWYTHGMRGTNGAGKTTTLRMLSTTLKPTHGTVVLDGVFVPDESVVLSRPAGEWHQVWNTILPIALPIFMAAYVGIAERAARMALERAADRRDRPEVQLAVGEMHNQLAVAGMALEAMIARANDYDFSPDLAAATASLTEKAVLTRAVQGAVESAVELAGGAGFFRRFGFERLSRDIRAAHFHPFPERKQQLFAGRVALGLDPAPAVR